MVILVMPFSGSRSKNVIEKSPPEHDMTQNEHVDAILCRPEIVVDVLSSGNVKTIKGYVVLNFEAVSLSCFRANQMQPFVKCVDDGRAYLSPMFWVKK